jgi:N-acetylglutamate synthase-like GNAT family acetyltransferase
MAEVAFSVARDWQRRSLSKIIMRKLAEAARDNGISGLFAFTSIQNKAMIALFRTLPYRITSTYEDDMIHLTCRFDETPEDDKTAGVA